MEKMLEKKEEEEEDEELVDGEGGRGVEGGRGGGGGGGGGAGGGGGDGGEGLLFASSTICSVELSGFDPPGGAIMTPSSLLSATRPRQTPSCEEDETATRRQVEGEQEGEQEGGEREERGREGGRRGRPVPLRVAEDKGMLEKLLACASALLLQALQSLSSPASSSHLLVQADGHKLVELS
eukprot:534518-Hanusia_phi.AAC.2